MSDFGGGDAQGGGSGSLTGDPSGGGFPGFQTNEQTGNQNQNSGQQQQEVDWGQNDFLKNVAPEDKASVERYLKSIDAGISRRFQELHGQVRPYQELGDVESLQQAMQISQLLDTNPRAIYDALAEALKDELNPQGQGNLENGTLNSDLQGVLPPEFMTQFQQQQEALQAVAQYILDQQTSQQNEQLDSQLETELAALKVEFGDFDEEYVLAKAYASGGDLAKAAQSWRDMVQKGMTGLGQLQNMPPIMGGGGVVPQANSQSVEKLSRSDTQELVAQMLAKQAQH